MQVENNASTNRKRNVKKKADVMKLYVFCHATATGFKFKKFSSSVNKLVILFGFITVFVISIYFKIIFINNYCG